MYRGQNFLTWELISKKAQVVLPEAAEEIQPAGDLCPAAEMHSEVRLGFMVGAQQE